MAASTVSVERKLKTKAKRSGTMQCAADFNRSASQSLVHRIHNFMDCRNVHPCQRDKTDGQLSCLCIITRGRSSTRFHMDRADALTQAHLMKVCNF